MSDPDYTIPISLSEKSSQTGKARYGYKALSRGDTIGKKYQIVQELGSGGFATTYLAEIIVDNKNHHGQKCVIKQLQPRFNSPAVWENARERLDTEGMVLQWLGKHNQIPKLIDHFDENGQFYLVLEFIEGEEFDREVQKKPLNEAQTIRFLYDVLNILKFVHQQGVIHRDIKPSNLIRRTKDKTIALIDFGAVKEIGTAIFESPQESVRTQVIGTPGYMPPEQNSGRPLYSSDIYALGKTAIYGLTGRSPTEWEEIEANDMVSWEDKTRISHELARIIRRMISPKTAERYQFAEEVLKDLTPLLKVGTTVKDRYLIVNYIGGEQRIENYLVKDTAQTESSFFYLQILHPEATDKDSLNQIQAEIEVEIAKIDKVCHKQKALKVLDCFVDRNSICLIQEYVEGRNLAQIIDQQSVLSEEEVINILLGAISALMECHKHKIIHGNIQPSSLLIKNNNQVILQNFGSINRFANNYLNSNLGYIPPEQIAGRITFASDIYALGMTAIHCLTGTIPQKLGISNQTGEILWQKKAKVNPQLTKAINKMVCLERQKRYSSASQTLKVIKSIKKKHLNIPWKLFLFGSPILIGVSAFAWFYLAQNVAILEFYKGDLDLEDREYQSAIQYYNEGLRKIPKTRKNVKNFKQVWLRKAKAFNQLKEYEKALATCQEALRYYQDHLLWNCQGIALDNLEQQESAINAYNQAIALNSDYVWSWNNRGDAYAKIGKAEQAIDDFKQAIELSSDEAFIPWNNMGKLYLQQKQYYQAIEAYNNALKSKKDYLPSLIGLGNAYKALGNYEYASRAYDEAIKINPNSYESWFGKALVAEALGQYSRAKIAYERALSINANGKSAQEGLARVQNR